MSACPHVHQSGMSYVRAHCIISRQPLLLSFEAQTGSKSGSNLVLVGLCWSGLCFKLLNLLILNAVVF